MKKADVISALASGNFAVVSDGHTTVRNGKPYTIADYASDAYIPYAPCAGVWNGQTDNGAFFPCMDRIAAAECGRTFYQTSVLAGGAIVYCDGLTLPDALDMDSIAVQTDFPFSGDYTCVQCDDGYVYFQCPPLTFATNGERAAWYRTYLAQDMRAAYRDNRAG